MAVFEQVAAAFLAQAAQWRIEMARATADFDIEALAALIHKMTGSCQTVAALGVAQEFEWAGRALPSLSPRDWASRYAALEGCLSQLEADIQAITSQADALSQANA